MKHNTKHFEIYLMGKSADKFSVPTLRMIKTLKECYQMEIDHPGKPYGPADFKGSLIGLYKRELLDFYSNKNLKSKPVSWYITTRGLYFLISIANRPRVVKDALLVNNINNLKSNLSQLTKSIQNLKITSGKVSA